MRNLNCVSQTYLHLLQILNNFMGSCAGRQDEKYIDTEQLYKVKTSQLKLLLFRSIVAITFEPNQSSQGKGSGILISSNLVITAAHNIYNSQLKRENTNFKVYIPVAGMAQEYYSVENWRYHEEFQSFPDNEKGQRIKYDYALLKLKRHIPYRRYLALSQPCCECLREQNKDIKISIVGFPGNHEDNYKPDNIQGTRFILNLYGLTKDNAIMQVDPNKFYIGYAISTTNGQSGTGACIEDRIIAIHVAGGADSQNFNIGRLVTPDLIDSVEKWRKQLDGMPFTAMRTQMCSHNQGNSIQVQQKQRENVKYQKLTEALKKSEDQVRRLRQDSEIYERTRNNKSSSRNSQRSYQGSFNGSSLNNFSEGNKEINIKHLNAQNLTTEDLKRKQLFASLQQLYLNFNKLAQIDLRMYPRLTRLELQRNLISKIDTSKNLNLTDLNLSENQLETVNLDRNSLLIAVYLSNNKLKLIKIQKSFKIERLWINDNCLGQAIFCYHAQLWETHFENQKSNQCRIRLLHSKEMYIECLEWGKINVDHRYVLSLQDRDQK